MHRFHLKIQAFALHVSISQQDRWTEKSRGRWTWVGVGRSGLGLRCRGREQGSRVGVRTKAPRSGRRCRAWLVAGTGLASAGRRASGARDVDLRASPWPEAVGGGCLWGGGVGVGEEQQSDWRRHRGRAGYRGQGVRSGGWAA
jgi:hypothetical protein